MTKKDILNLYGINSFISNEDLEKELTDKEVEEFQNETIKFATSFMDIFADSYSDNEI